MLQLGWLWPCPQILRPYWKGFPRTNALAYLASSSAPEETSFITGHKFYNIDTRKSNEKETTDEANVYLDWLRDERAKDDLAKNNPVSDVIKLFLRR